MLDTTVNPLHCRPFRKKLKMRVQPSHCQGHPRSGSAVLGKVRKLTVTTGSSSCHGGGRSSILISCCLNKCSNKIFIQVFLFLKCVHIFCRVCMKKGLPEYVTENANNVLTSAASVRKMEINASCYDFWDWGILKFIYFKGGGNKLCWLRGHLIIAETEKQTDYFIVYYIEKKTTRQTQ